MQPLAVVLEDLHWIDTESQSVLNKLVETLPTRRLLLLVNYRPSYQHGWAENVFYQKVALEALSAGSMEDLLGTLLGSDPSLEPLKRALIERTGGNPLFLEESARTLVETKILTGERGAYRLTKSADRIEVPASVQAILAARIDRLPPEEKALLQTAAAIGKDVPYALLRRVAQLPEEAMRRYIANLRAAEFLYDTSFLPELAYTFKHALTHEVAYGCLLHGQRRALHARIAAAIEELEPDRLPQHGDRLANHAFLGGLWPKAVAYLGQAGERALAVAAYGPAVSFFEQALAALQHLPEGPDTRMQAVDLHLNIRHALQVLGELERSGKHLEEAERLAKAGGDPRQLARVYSFMAQYFRVTGDLSRAVQSGERALATAERLNDSALRDLANGMLGAVYISRGDYRKAAEILRRCAGPSDALPPDQGVAGLGPVFWRIYLIFGLAPLGDFREAIGYGDAGLRLAEAANSQYGLIFASLGLGTLALVKGDAAQAIVLLERGLALGRTLKLPLAVPPFASALGAAYSLSGRSSDAIPLLEEGVWEGVSMKRLEGHSLLLARLAEAYLLVGRIEDASSRARQAVRLAHEREERGHEAYAMYMLGEIAACEAPVNIAAAETSYRRGLALADELSMRPLVAHCHRGLGRLYQCIMRQEAQEHLTTATRMYREMGMTYWLEKAEPERKDLG